jgi:hypothetical protein
VGWGLTAAVATGVGLYGLLWGVPGDPSPGLITQLDTASVIAVCATAGVALGYVASWQVIACLRLRR